MSPQDTLIPRADSKRARFERVIAITDAAGNTTYVADDGRVDSKTTDRIARLAPVRQERDAEWLVVAAFALVLFGAGFLAHVFIAHF